MTLSSFPISSGAKISAVPVIFIDRDRSGPLDAELINIGLVTSNNYLFLWSIASFRTGRLFWTGELGNTLNSSFVDAAMGDNIITTFFPKDRAYNWPNPVYDGETFIHFYVAENSKINIKIFDLAGDLTAELNDTAVGGFEHETPWNVSNIESGVYFARIEAIGISGKRDSKLIKIAVIK